MSDENQPQPEFSEENSRKELNEAAIKAGHKEEEVLKLPSKAAVLELLKSEPSGEGDADPEGEDGDDNADTNASDEGDGEGEGDGEDNDTEDDTDDTVSTPEENEEATKAAAEQAKQNKAKQIAARKAKLQAQLKDQAAKAAKAREERAAGKTKKYKFAFNFKCDGKSYEAGKTYELPNGVAQLALDADCLEV